MVEKSARYSQNRRLTCKVLQVIQLTVDMPYMAGLSTGNSVDKPASLGRSMVTFPTCRIWQEFPSVYQDQTVSLPLPEHLSSARSPPLTEHSHQKMPSYSPSLPAHSPCVYGKTGLGFYLDIEHFSHINTDVQTDGLVSQQKSKFSVFKSSNYLIISKQYY